MRRAKNSGRTAVADMAQRAKRATRPSSEPRAWQRMLSGRRLDLLAPSPLDVELEDIAHGLARVARWNGQTKGAHIFSVAQHCLLVEALARLRAPRLQLKSGRAAPPHRDPSALRTAGGSLGRDQIADQGGRQRRRLSRSHPACR